MTNGIVVLLVAVPVAVLSWMTVGYLFAVIRWKWLDNQDEIIEDARQAVKERTLLKISLNLPSGEKIEDVSPFIISDTIESAINKLTKEKARRRFLIMSTLAGPSAIIGYYLGKYLIEDYSHNS